MTDSTAPATVATPALQDALAPAPVTGWRREFPDFPVYGMPAIPAGWEDTSWHNDACPSFQVTGTKFGEALTCWINTPVVAHRDWPASFALTWRGDNGLSDDGRGVYEGEDWNQVLHLATVERLAFAFAQSLYQDLTAEEWQTMRARNATVPAGVCASHDFRDANMNMSDAFESVVGRAIMLCGDTKAGYAVAQVDADLWNQAWDVAKRYHLTASGGVAAAFDAWRLTGHDVDSLPFDDQEGFAGRVYDPGHLVTFNGYVLNVSNLSECFDNLADAEQALWDLYAMNEVCRDLPDEDEDEDENPRATADTLAHASPAGINPRATPAAPAVAFTGLTMTGALSQVLQAFCAEEELPARCALELLHEDLSPRQRVWLSQFLIAWEAAETAEAATDEE